MSLKEIFTLLCDKLEDKPDDYDISIGDWQKPSGVPFTEFNAIFRLGLGEIRKLVKWKSKKHQA